MKKLVVLLFVLILFGCTTAEKYSAELGQAADIATTVPSLAYEVNPIIASAPYLLPVKLVLPKIAREAQADREACEAVNTGFGMFGWTIGGGFNLAVLAGLGGPAGLAVGSGAAVAAHYLTKEWVTAGSKKVCAHKPGRTPEQWAEYNAALAQFHCGPFNDVGCNQ